MPLGVLSLERKLAQVTFRIKNTGCWCLKLSSRTDVAVHTAHVNDSLWWFALAYLHCTMPRSRDTALSLCPHNLTNDRKKSLATVTDDHKMSSIITAILDCVKGSAEDDQPYLQEKRPLAHDPCVRPLDEVANEVVNAILRAEKAGARLKADLDSIVGPYGWKEYLAEKVLEKLSAALQGAHDKLGPAIRDAYHKAWSVANEIEDFVIKNPIMCTIIALGVLVIIAPGVIEALGFAEFGPVEGTCTSGICLSALPG